MHPGPSCTLARQPGQTTGKMAQEGNVLPSGREVPERGGDDPAPPLGEAPCEREAELRPGDPGAPEVELGLVHPQQHPGIGPQVAELVDLVVPPPVRAQVDSAGWDGSQTSRTTSWVQGWPLKRAPTNSR